MQDKPTGYIPESTRTVRKGYLDEEVRELHEAVDSGDIEAIAKEAADVVYVVIGTAISCGIPFDRVLEEVHRSNMTKTPDGDGKAIKGEGYQPPDIRPIIREAMAGRPRDTGQPEAGQ